MQRSLIQPLRTLRPNPLYLPHYANRYTPLECWIFSDLCKRDGYDRGRRWAEFIMQYRFDLQIPENSNLLKSFRAFLDEEEREKKGAN